MLQLAGAALVIRAVGAAWMMARRDGGTASALTSFPLDDAWIHLVYARSLARGDLLAYLDGVPEAGSTSPLWALLLAPLCALAPSTAALVVAVKALGVSLAALGTWLAALLVWELRQSHAAAWLALAFTALEPATTAASVSGMEVALAGTLVVGALWAYVRGRRGVAATLGGLCLLARPELALVPAALLCAWAWDEREPLQSASDRMGALRRLAPLAAPPLLLGLAWVAFCLWSTGRPLPNTFYVKHSAANLVVASSDAGRALFAMGRLAGMGAGVGFVAWGAVFFERSAPSARHHRFIAALALALLAGLIWAHDLRRPTWFYVERYLLPVAPLVLTVVALGTHQLATRAASEPKGPRRYAWAALATAIVVAALVRLPARAEADAARHAWSTRNIEEQQETLAAWLRERLSDDPDAWVATHDAGAIRYLTDARVLDLMGLNEHRIPQARAQLMRERDPRFVALIPSWFPALMRDPRYREVFRVRSEHYVICTDCAQEVMVILERHDTAALTERAPPR